MAEQQGKPIMEGTPPPTAPQRGDVVPGSVVKGEPVPPSPHTTPILPGMGNKGTQVTPTSPRGRLFGHQRTPSMEFKELTKKDAQISLAQEMEKLARTSNMAEKEMMVKTFAGFQRLFSKFIN